MDGILNIYKERGFTSHDVVAKLRGICGQRKIGHMGTLDPEAEGVLPVCLGKATRVCDLLTDEDKEYETVLLLGTVTDTQDIFGQVLSEKPVEVDEKQVREAISRFIGTISQVPPMYSAIKVGGKKLYELARAGKEVEREAREVHISSIDILSVELPRVSMRVACSRGTYIRTLCHDIGESLGCGGCMEKLTRTRVGSFLLKDSLPLSAIQKRKDEGSLPEALIPVEAVFCTYVPVKVKPSLDKKLKNGGALRKEELSPLPEKADSHTGTDEKTLRVYDEAERFVGLYRWNGREYRAEKIFYNNEE